MPKLSVPYDIISSIVQYVPIQKVKVVVDVLSPELDRSMKDSVYDHRTNPLPYLRQLTDSPEELLRCMLVYNVIISGSRAAEYFSPGITTKGSDWDFYVRNDVCAVSGFMYSLTKMGVIWLDVEAEASDDEGEYKSLEMRCARGTLYRNGKYINIQVIRSKKACVNAAFQLGGFHSTIVQCYISGSSAVCMYSNLTSNYKSLCWLHSKKNYGTDLAPAHYWLENISGSSKYEQRGIKYITYDEYSVYADKYVKGAGILGHMRSRNPGDGLAYRVPISKFMKEEATATLSRRLYGIEIDDYKWAEMPYSMHWSDGEDSSYVEISDIMLKVDELFTDRWNYNHLKVMTAGLIMSRIVTPLVRQRVEQSLPPHLKWLNRHFVITASSSADILHSDLENLVAQQ